MMIDRQGKKTLASEARHYIYLQRESVTLDGEGGEVKTWVDVQRLSAAVLPIQARQQFNFKSIGVDATHLVKIRGKINVDENLDRIRFNSRYFEIVTVEDIQEKGVLKVITCKEMR